MEHSPPCCASCPELDRKLRSCRLLSDPSPTNRQRLLTMPCDAERLVRHRFRPFGERVSSIAKAVWDDVAATIAAPTDAPLDARVWLGAWPLAALAESVFDRAEPAQEDRSSERAPSPLASNLATLLAADPVACALVVDGVASDLDDVAWRAGLAEGDSAFADRVALALYRALLLDAGALRSVEPRAAALVEARFLRRGDFGEAAALVAARAGLGEPELGVAAFREGLASAVRATLEFLAASPRTAALVTLTAMSAFQRALRVEDAFGEVGSREPRELDTSYVEPIFEHLRRSADARVPPATHPSTAAIFELAGGALHATRAAHLFDHVLACDACRGLFRADACARALVRKALSGHGADVPVLAPALGGYTPRLIRCRDVVWETFSAMAAVEGRSVDELVEDALEHYRSLRAHARRATSAAEPAPATPRSHELVDTPRVPAVIPRAAASREPAAPPPPRPRPSTRDSVAPKPADDARARVGLRLGASRSAPPPPDGEEVTTPRLSNPLEEVTKPATPFPGSKETRRDGDD
ncbi:MAG: hypothetical protein U0271_30320 [Polyangiaceae bacterium]